MRSNLLILSGIVLLAVVTFSLLIYGALFNSMSNALRARARTSSEFFSGFVAGSEEEFTASAVTYVGAFGEGDKLELQYVGVDGRVEASSFGVSTGTSPGTPDIREAMTAGEITAWSGLSPETGERILAVSAPMTRQGGETMGVLRYVTSLVLLQRRAAGYTLAAVGAAAVLMAVTILTNLFFIRSVVTPLRAVTRVVHRIAEGSYGTRITRTYRDEVGELVDSINEMSAKIGEAEKMQTEFISSVSHELRMPLTAINGWSETLLYDENLDADAQKGLQVIQKEASRLTKMVEELLIFTRMENGRFTLNVQKLDVLAEVEESVTVYAELLRQDGLELHYDPWDGDCPLIDGDPERLRQVFLNLLDNAAKYGREGGRIDVSTWVKKDRVYVRVRDHGPGVPPEALQKLKTKFYKVNPKTRGSGIGLAVCDEIVRFHNGELTLANAEGGGLEATVSLPLPGAEE